MAFANLIQQFGFLNLKLKDEVLGLYDTYVSKIYENEWTHNSFSI